MRKGLRKRVKEVKRATRDLQRRGWTVTKFVLEMEDCEEGMHPYVTLTLRYDPEKPHDIL